MRGSIPTDRPTVLVYSGPGASPICISQTVRTLRAILSPTYTVDCILPSVLLSTRWYTNCALLIMPGGRDLPYQASLGTEGNDIIKRFVSSGGAYLGLCAGGYYGAAECKFMVGDPDEEIVGPRELAFWPTACWGPVFDGFDYYSERGSKVVAIEMDDVNSVLLEDGDYSGASVARMYYNGGGAFELAPEQAENAKIIARFSDHPDAPPAIVFNKVDDGKVVLIGFHPEFSLLNEPLAGLLERLPVSEAPSPEDVYQAEGERIRLMRNMMGLLGLKTSTQTKRNVFRHKLAGSSNMSSRSNSPSHQGFPRVLVSNPDRSIDIAAEIEQRFSSSLPRRSAPLPSIATETKDSCSPTILVDAVDTFRLHTLSPTNTAEAIQPILSSASDDQSGGENLAKDIWIVSVDADEKQDSSWNWLGYWNELDRLAEWKENREIDGISRMGDIVMGENELMVGDDWTWLEKNPRFLHSLPTPLVHLSIPALNPTTSMKFPLRAPTPTLRFSLVLKLPSSLARRVVFVQYLMALALCEVLDPLSSRKEAESILLGIRWPGDVVSARKTDTVYQRQRVDKVGGVEVTSSYRSGEFKVKINCQLDLVPSIPFLSLEPHLILPRILSHFSTLWKTFLLPSPIHGGFISFLDRYHTRWTDRSALATLRSADLLTSYSLQSNHGWGAASRGKEVKVQAVGISLNGGTLRLRKISVSKGAVPADQLADLELNGTDGWRREGGGEVMDLQPGGDTYTLVFDEEPRHNL
ncbi:Biotin holocarboxylase synthetase/biotin-protein ligase [Phaffia rhodozyma]|uniref:Biotin holocarboxylase synthetase/biotin-protein ligase n=1 Tax=Phaffia rhodozyma TaxID=264483 RepID=A0A0F7SWD9_PHARH|nr:Biotin holocarboxylase synthetase/biotin-protein ligase [Phaffia rhodozyma]